MGSQGFEPRSWDFSCLSTPIVHHNKYCSVTRIFLQRQLESQMMPGYTITPHITYNNKYILIIYKDYHSVKISFVYQFPQFHQFQDLFQGHNPFQLYNFHCGYEEYFWVLKIAILCI